MLKMKLKGVCSRDHIEKKTAVFVDGFAPSGSIYLMRHRIHFGFFQ